MGLAPEPVGALPAKLAALNLTNVSVHQLAAEAAVLCPPAYSQLTISTYLSTQPWMDQVKVFREVYRERGDATLA